MTAGPSLPDPVLFPQPVRGRSSQVIKTITIVERDWRNQLSCSPAFSPQCWGRGEAGSGREESVIQGRVVRTPGLPGSGESKPWPSLSDADTHENGLLIMKWGRVKQTHFLCNLMQNTDDGFLGLERATFTVSHLLVRQEGRQASSVAQW